MTASLVPRGNADHWQRVWRDKESSELSWTQHDAKPSLDWISRVAPAPGTRVLDVGGGASPLAGALAACGYRPAVLDIAPAALDAARAAASNHAGAVTMHQADISAPGAIPEAWRGHVDVWHDRAAFHFLVAESARAAYVANLEAALRPDGHAIIGTFAPDGPTTCSGLPVVRYDAEGLVAALDGRFALVDAARVEHVTPWGDVQPFQFVLLRAA